MLYYVILYDHHLKFVKRPCIRESQSRWLLGCASAVAQHLVDPPKQEQTVPKPSEYHPKMVKVRKFWDKTDKTLFFLGTNGRFRKVETAKPCLSPAWIFTLMIFWVIDLWMSLYVNVPMRFCGFVSISKRLYRFYYIMYSGRHSDVETAGLHTLLLSTSTKGSNDKPSPEFVHIAKIITSHHVHSHICLRYMLKIHHHELPSCHAMRYVLQVMPVNSLNLETCSTTVQGSTFEARMSEPRSPGALGRRRGGGPGGCQVPKRYRIDEPMSILDGRIMKDLWGFLEWGLITQNGWF